jgi:uncharacterized protein YcbK (DUF882 family)
MIKVKAMAALLAAFFVTSLCCAQASAHCGKDHSDELRGDGTLTLFRPVKNERETFKYRDADGDYSAEAMEKIAFFFRCRLTDEVHPIDPDLIEILDAIEDHFSAKEIRLISAFRSDARNSLMRSGNRRVARESYHTRGMAADIEVPGVSASAARDFAYLLGHGGIGYYRRRPFIHVDTGPLRTWGFKPAPAGRRHAPAMSQK